METTHIRLDLGIIQDKGTMDKGIMDKDITDRVIMAHQAHLGLTLDAPCVTLQCTATATRSRLTMLAAAVLCSTLTAARLTASSCTRTPARSTT